MHVLADAHDTPDKPLSIAPAGLGVGWIDQLVPSQRCTSGPLTEAPTTVQALGDAHDTAFRAPPTGVGVGWIDQLVPFQRSRNVGWSPVPLSFDPRAMQALGDAHDTSIKLMYAPEGFGVGWIDQRFPFQRSANVAKSPPVLDSPNPTAVHAVGEEHDT